MINKLKEYIDWARSVMKKEDIKPDEQKIQVITEVKTETKKRGRKPKVQS